MLHSIKVGGAGCRQATIASIIHHVATSNLPEFQRWRIGITDDFGSLAREWLRPEGFVSWRVASWEDARVIETFFVYVKGMIGGMSVEIDGDATVCVCLFPA